MLEHLPSSRSGGVQSMLLFFFNQEQAYACAPFHHQNDPTCMPLPYSKPLPWPLLTLRLQLSAPAPSSLGSLYFAPVASTWKVSLHSPPDHWPTLLGFQVSVYRASSPGSIFPHSANADTCHGPRGTLGSHYLYRNCAVLTVH